LHQNVPEQILKDSTTGWN